MGNRYTILEIGTGYTSIPSKIGAATEIVVEELAKAASIQGLDVYIFDINDKNRPENNFKIKEVFVPAFIANTLDYKLGFTHKLKRLLYSISLAFHLIRFIKKNRRYTLHFHNQYNFFFFYVLCSKKRMKNIKLFYTNHTYTWSRSWPEIERLIAKKYFMESFSMKKANMVFVLNEMTTQNLVDHLGLPPGKVKLIPNGVNTKVYYKLPAGDKNVALLSKKLNLEGKKTIIHVGVVCDRKNQLEIIKWLTPLFKQIPEIVFLFAGAIREMEYYHNITEYCKIQNIEKNVIYLGELPPGKILNEHYNLAIGFILFSKSEGFSLALLEALSSGLPVLISKNLEIDFIKEKDNGILFFEKQRELSDVFIKEVYAPERQIHHSEKAVQFIQRNYSWDKISNMYFGQLLS
jgi:glycosyltransferase involved in cell wall biosynthesis